ncbi:FecR domain-containing protein [Ohtaekwangia sp.]|uniref:FecR domain-containing protein n=1 Tax=Ohtaekwangia sp. TaxID=2066019 RepID=UPI002FDEE064
MTPETTWQKISAYLSGDLTEAERVIFESWLKESEENRYLFRDAKKIWDSSGIKLQIPDAATEAELVRFYDRAERENAPGRIIPLFLRENWWQIAASIIVVLMGAYILWPFRSIHPPRQEEIAYHAGNEVLTVYLPDSTRVWLNRNSSLSYSKDFNASRKVKLQGEGYFQVRKDASRPFEVSTRTTAAVVLGTSFNVKEEDSLTTLTVADGKVRFSSIEAEGIQPVVVTRNEQATFSGDTKSLRKSSNRNRHFASWRKHYNPIYEREKKYSAYYLATRYSWRKNAINQSVIDGRIVNRSSLATYTDIVLTVTYSRSGGPRHTTEVVIRQPVKPGQTIDYRRRLLDIFTDTSFLHVQVKSAEIADDEY